jgi:hypothetical protein
MQFKDLSQEAKAGITHERSKNGPFISLEVFPKKTGSHIHLQRSSVMLAKGKDPDLLLFNSIREDVFKKGTLRP